MLRQPATPIPPVEPTRREARLVTLAVIAYLVLFAAGMWRIQDLMPVAVAVGIWHAFMVRGILRRVEPDAGWGRTSHAQFDKDTDARIVRATGWPRALVHVVRGAAFVAFFAAAVWSLWR